MDLKVDSINTASNMLRFCLLWEL